MTIEQALDLHNGFRQDGKWRHPTDVRCEGPPGDDLLSVEILRLVSPTAEWIIKISESGQLRYLRIKTPRTSDLTPLTNLALTQFEISYPTRIKEWRFLSNLTGLRRLFLDNTTSFTDTSCLENLHNVEFLGLAGGYSKPLRIKCLKSLSAMHSLKAIYLANVRLEDWDLSPLGQLKQLQLLYTPKWCPAQEIRKLREAIPDLKWNWDKTPASIF
jgi:hypothetical protein